ncbi:MAG: arylsulfotransferase family protein [Acidobacteriota bacterium]
MKIVWSVILWSLVSWWALAPAVKGNEEPTREDPPKTEEPEEVQALRSLGYISHPPESPADEKRRRNGVVLNRRPHVTPGFTLITEIPEARAVLVANSGETVRTWEHGAAEQWARAVLLEDGDLLVVGRLPASAEEESRIARAGPSPNLDPLDGKSWYPFWGKYLARYAWDGSLRWRRGLRAHHDVEEGSDGRILTLGLRERTVDDLLFQDHTILLLSPDGEIEKQLSLFDVLTSDPGRFDLPRSTDFPKALRSNGVLDLLHANAASRMPFPALGDRGGIYCPSCVLVTVRHQNLVAVIDIEKAKLLWVWGPGELQYPHEGRWLENGHVMIFDNGTRDRGYSRLVEVDPATGEIVWTYRTKKPEAFFTPGRGTAQALPGGNVLVSSANQGKVFEVTRRGRVVWRYIVRGDDGRLLAMRAAKYPREWVMPHLRRGRSAGR